MKKSVIFLLTCLTFIALSACSKTVDNEDTQTGDKSGISAEEIFNQALDRQNAVKSMSSDITFNENVILGDGEEKSEMPTSGTLKIDRIVKPESMYVTGKISSFDVESEENIDTDLDIYVIDNYMYLKDSYIEENAWAKFPKVEMDDMLGTFANEVNSIELLKSLEPFIADFEVEEKDGAYFLTLNKANESFTSYIIEHMQLTNTLGLEQEEIKNALKIDQINYVLKMNKETFDLLEIDELVKMSFQFEEDPMFLETNVKIKYSNIDNVPEIKIPQDVIDNAVEVE